MTAADGHQPLVKCGAWCGYQDGHPGMQFEEDQVCVGVASIIERQLEPEVPDGYRMAGWPLNDYDEVYLQGTASAPYIAVSHLGDPEQKYTLDEAEGYAQTLLALVRSAR